MDAYVYVILAYCILSMVIGFGLISQENRFVMAIFQVTAKLVEPALNPIRAILPQTGMMDFSPLVLLLSLQFLFPYILRGVFRSLVALYAG
ncbi:YggT family protein [Acetobacteraceae bacterium]|nr:YggT family protein [Acetobacteraceae bacterium]